MKVSDKVIQSLYQLIEQQGMKVGDRLASERKLCEQLGVSRSSLREALQQLNTQGIVQSRLGDGTYICQLPVTWSQHKIVQPLSGLIDQDPLYRFDVQEARLVLEGEQPGMQLYALLLRTVSRFITFMTRSAISSQLVIRIRLR